MLGRGRLVLFLFLTYLLWLLGDVVQRVRSSRLTASACPLKQ